MINLIIDGEGIIRFVIEAILNMRCGMCRHLTVCQAAWSID